MTIILQNAQQKVAACPIATDDFKGIQHALEQFLSLARQPTSSYLYIFPHLV